MDLETRLGVVGCEQRSVVRRQLQALQHPQFRLAHIHLGARIQGLGLWFR